MLLFCGSRDQQEDNARDRCAHGDKSCGTRIAATGLARSTTHSQSTLPARHGSLDPIDLPCSP